MFICIFISSSPLRVYLTIARKFLLGAALAQSGAYIPVAKRLDQPHLRGYDPSKAPTFSFPPEVVEAFDREEARRAAEKKKREADKK